MFEQFYGTTGIEEVVESCVCDSAQDGAHEEGGLFLGLELSLLLVSEGRDQASRWQGITKEGRWQWWWWERKREEDACLACGSRRLHIQAPPSELPAGWLWSSQNGRPLMVVRTESHTGSCQIYGGPTLMLEFNLKV
jgi:hypothetical protein